MLFRSIGLKNRLARYDLSVAKYYVKRDALIAAANRAKQVVETYPDTPETEEALEIMIESYDTLKMPTLAQHAREVLGKNYPENRHAKG